MLFLQGAYKLACQRFGRFLDGPPIPKDCPEFVLIRKQIVEREFEEHGAKSIYKACEIPFVSGNKTILQALNFLTWNRVHTKEELLQLKVDRIDVVNPAFDGLKESLSLMKDMFAAEKAIQ